MGSGASRINSSVQEFHDRDEAMCEDLKSELFFTPNLQVRYVWLKYIKVEDSSRLILSQWELFFTLG